MQKTASVDEYLARHSQWRETLNTLREILNSTELEETVKWGMPTYVLGGKNVAGLAAFKNHAALWFMQGALLADKAGRLVNAQQGRTKAQRQWRFGHGDRVDRVLVRQYVKEAIANQKAGRRVKLMPAKASKLPAELSAVMKAQPALAAAFKQLAAYKRREYAEYIREAKKESTRASRLTKIIPTILAGKSLNDRYRT